VTASVFDLALYSADGTALITNQTGTNNINFNSGNVGIGATNPESPLHIRRDSTTSQTVLLLHNNNMGDNGIATDVGIAFRGRTWGGSTDSILGKIAMSSPASQDDGTMRFYTGEDINQANIPLERMSITSNGYVRLTSSSGGIQFNGDTASANALDDYEEGSFTPSSLGTDFSSISVTFGRYIKIGNQVTINCRWSVTPGGTGMKYLVFDLPFAFVNNGNVAFTGAVSNYNEGLSSGSSNVGTTTRNSSGSVTQQYVQAYYTSTNTSTLLLSMTYFTFF